MTATSLSPLLASAQAFLTESLANLRDQKLSLAIVHAVTAAELILKERLARLNPALIFQNIDTRVPQRERTVSLSALPQRLTNLGMPLGSKQACLIKEIARWRHQIVHHMPEFDPEVARKQLPKLLDFLATFLRDELGTPLESFLPNDLYNAANLLLNDWQEAVATASAKAAQEGNVLPDTCPQCAGVAVLCLRAGATVHCHLCGAALYRCDRCLGCGRPTVMSYEQHAFLNYCDECVEAAGDAYLQMQADIERGK